MKLYVLMYDRDPGYDCGTYSELLGVYSTEEKAKEALEENLKGRSNTEESDYDIDIVWLNNIIT